MLEKNLQKNCLKFCKSKSILAHKVDSSSSRGFPDLTVVLPNGVVLFCELKTPRGKLSALQQDTIQELQDRKANVYVVRSIEQFVEIVESHLKPASGSE